MYFVIPPGLVPWALATNNSNLMNTSKSKLMHVRKVPLLLSMFPYPLFSYLMEWPQLNSVNQSFIYSQKETTINRYNEIKLNKTNKTLRNNVTIYFEKRACWKLKSLIIKPCVFKGDCRHPGQRSL